MGGLLCLHVVSEVNASVEYAYIRCRQCASKVPGSVAAGVRYE